MFSLTSFDVLGYLYRWKVFVFGQHKLPVAFSLVVVFSRTRRLAFVGQISVN